MGTRHLICIVLNKEIRMAQYGQWDGYPTGQGQEIVDFIRGADLKDFKEKVSKTRMLTDAEMELKFKDPNVRNTQFSRDTGAKILNLITKGETELRQNEFDFGAESLFCEWAYVLDLDNEALEVYHGFNKTGTALGRFANVQSKEEKTSYSEAYGPVTLLAALPFKLLTPSFMKKLEESQNEEE